MLNVSSGIEEIGHVQWELSLFLLLAWVICYFCIWKGVRSTAKVIPKAQQCRQNNSQRRILAFKNNCLLQAVYITATFPFFMLAVLLIRGLTLPGALYGIKHYLYPNITRLADPQVLISPYFVLSQHISLQSET